MGSPGLLVLLEKPIEPDLTNEYKRMEEYILRA
jgi:hypothetical protein